MGKAMRRSKFEQIIDTLSHAVQPIIKSHLLSKANISYYQAQPLLKFLEEKGYLEIIDPPCLTYKRGKERKTNFMYLTTQKGLEALKLLNSPPLKGLLDCYEWIREQKEEK
jgi:predicted transcriptional regulator